MRLPVHPARGLKAESSGRVNPEKDVYGSARVLASERDARVFFGSSISMSPRADSSSGKIMREFGWRTHRAETFNRKRRSVPGGR